MAVHTPGHTPGSLCLYHPERHILICGDAIINKHPLTGKKGLRESVATFSVNPAQMRESIRKLAGLDVEMLLTGHGEPILGNASALIKALRY
jgi:glyoxylase-like metal-dependent hydrolase (beta-lactamase superfamily II)